MEDLWSFSTFHISFISSFASFKILTAFSRHKISLSTTLSFLYPSALNLTCFLFFENSFQAFIPLLVFHATTYLSLIHLSEQKIQGNLFNPVKSWAKILLIIIIFGLGEKLITEYFDVFKDSTSLKGNILISLLVSLSVLPNLMHYYLDGKIWKKDDPDFKKIISSVWSKSTGYHDIIAQKKSPTSIVSAIRRWKKIPKKRRTLLNRVKAINTKLTSNIRVI